MEKSTQELFNDFKSDFNNFMELSKDDFNNIREDVKKNRKNTLDTLKALLNMRTYINDIIKTAEIYFNSSVLETIDELKDKPELEEIIKNYLNPKSAPVKEIRQKRGIARETDESGSYLKSGFYDINELFGYMVEYFAIVKNINFTPDIKDEQKPTLIINNLNSMLRELLSIEITIKDNIATIVLNEIKKKEVKIKKAA